MAELPIATARQFEGISFRPDSWAARENEGLSQRVAHIRTKAAEIAARDGSHPIDPALVEKLVDRQARLSSAYWAAMSRCMSTMIAGPANFPVERNRKRGEVAHKRMCEMAEYLPVAVRALERAAFPHGLPGDAIRGDDPEALAKLQARLAEKPKYAERKRLETRISNLTIRQERGRVERQCAGFSVIEDPDLDRIQLVFADRPDEATRSVLKRRGFRWAPSQGAWQRHLNNNGRNAARFVESDLAKAEASA